MAGGPFFFDAVKWELKASHTPTLQLCGRGRLPFPFLGACACTVTLHVQSISGRFLPERSANEMWLQQPQRKRDLDLNTESTYPSSSP